MTMPHDATSRRVELALAAHARGWAVTPLHGTEAYLPGWPKRPPPTRDDVVAWATAGNVGIRTGRVSGVLIVDVDVHRGGVIPAWAEAAPRVRTGRGGAHCYFAWPAEPVPNSKDRVAPGVEMLGDGKQAVYAGSVHPETGAIYEWEVEPGAELPPFPEDVAATLRAAKAPKVERPPLRVLPSEHPGLTAYGRRAIQLELRRVREAPEGRRNDELNIAAFNLGQLHAGGEIPEVQDDLLAAALEVGLPTTEAEKTIRSGWGAGVKEPRKAPPRAPRPGPPTGRRPAKGGVVAEPGVLCTDLGNARRLVRLHGQDLRFTGAMGWLVWDGRRWRRDETGEAERRAKDTVRAIWDEIRGEDPDDDERVTKWAVKSQGAARIEAMLKLARSEPELSTRDEEFDRDAWLLNVLNGTIDLRTGELRPHRREDLLTKLVPVAYDPAATAPRWLAFLEQVQPDPDARGFLARYAGYCLTGEMGEQVFAVHHGGGSNGKGVYSDTLLAVFGDYASVTPYATFVQRRPDAPTNDLAALRGARLVVASEPNEGMRLDEGAVKSITGEDPVSARFHYREFFTYRPTCKLILTGNHRPRIRGTDHAMWRRVLLVPWPVTVTKPDKDLRRRLREELPGILRWIVEGCLAWQRDGLRPPAVVRAAVDEYREAEDHVGRFIADRCALGSDLVVSAKDLRASYELWVESEGEEAFSAKALGARLTDRGIRAVKDVAGIRGRGWQGIALATHATLATLPGESASHTRARGDLPEQSADASQASQPGEPLSADLCAGDGVASAGDARPRWPVCPLCSRADREAAADDGCDYCRQFLAAKGVIPPDPRDGPAPGHPGDERWS
jgi:putative DNA primase/helicase